ncbi:MAG: pitrilysin family protein [Thermodesulfobacteriota bacterium]|nr:pitrilysin family protein [Thermodesulfobacteriota bacterium]
MIKKTLFISLFSIILGATPSFALDHTKAQHPGKMVFKPLTFSPAKAERTVLKDGMVLYVLEDHELPVINLSATIRTGSIYEPEEKAGLAKLTGKVMRTGGTSSLTPDEINDQLEYIAGIMEVSIGRESGSASLSVMKKDIDMGLKIFADVLISPRLSQKKLDLAKKQEVEAIRRENDNPNSIAFREFRRFLYRDNPRGRIPTKESINAITRGDLVDFHSRFFTKENIILGVSGDFNKDKIARKIEKAFQGWQKTSMNIPKPPPPEQSYDKFIGYAFKGVPQSTIVTGHLTVNKKHPDHYPFKILNFILGEGGFSSRLTSEIRSNRGLAYSVRSFYRGDVDYGVFVALCQTKSKTTYQALSLIYKIIKGLKEDGVTDAELAWAKESIMNKFVFSFTSSYSIVNQQMQLEYDEMPQHFLEDYLDNISKVTLEDIKRVANEYLHPDRSLIVIVGNGRDFDTPLSEFGEVNEIDLKEE